MISSENDNPGESLEEFLKNFVLVQIGLCNFTPKWTFVDLDFVT